jgi:hypothetical protein
MGFLFIGDLTCGFIVSREMPRLQKSRQIRISRAPLKSPWRKTAKCCAPPPPVSGYFHLGHLKSRHILINLWHLISIFYEPLNAKSAVSARAEMRLLLLRVFFLLLSGPVVRLNGSVKKLRPAWYIYLS